MTRSILSKSLLAAACVGTASLALLGSASIASSPTATIAALQAYSRASSMVAGRDITPAKIATVFEMQKHVKAISTQNGKWRSGEKNAADAYTKMGWNLLGEGIITPTGSDASLLRAAVAKQGDTIVVAFRGTKGDRGWETATSAIMIDGNIRQVAPSFVPSSRRGSMLVHAGFHRSYMKLRPKILAALRGQRGSRLFITGHSLGGALASLMAMDMAMNSSSQYRSITSITSGAPRVGNRAYANTFTQRIPDAIRVVLNKDPVPAIPYLKGKYEHAGRLLQLDKKSGRPVAHDTIDTVPNAGRFLTHHGNKHYYSATQLLRGDISRLGAFNPHGNSWASAAAAKERALAERGRVGQLVDKAKEGRAERKAKRQDRREKRRERRRNRRGD